MIRSSIKALFKLTPFTKSFLDQYENLKVEKERLTQQLSQLNPEKEQLSAEKDQLSAEKEQLSAEKDQLSAEKDQLSAEKDQLSAEKDQLTQVLIQSNQEKAMLESQLQKLESERLPLINSFFNYLLNRVPNEEEVVYSNRSDLSIQELFVHIVTSDEFKRQIRIPSNNHLFGLLTKAEEIQSYLIYPSFDTAQFFVSLTGEPYQLSDFNACIDFLRDQNLLDSEKRCFLDIGANIGSTSIYAISSRSFTHSVSIEASSLNYQFLLWNIAINGLQSQISPLNYGLADFVGERTLICSPYNCGDFRMSPETENPSDKYLYHEDQFKSEQVNFITLDELVKRNAFDASDIGFLWMDCQGSEGFIFKGGANFFSQVKIPIFVEFWPYGMNRLNCQADYFDFLSQYPVEIFTQIDHQMQKIHSDFLKDFYNQNLGNGQHLDILLLPKV